MKKAILVTLLASSLGLGAAAVQANDGDNSQRGPGYTKQDGGKHQGKRGGKRGGGKMMGRMIQKLELTDAQQAQLKTLQEAQKTKREALREQMKSLRTEMKALDSTSADYQNQVAALADKKANIDRQRFIQRSEAKQQFQAILTEEQRAKLAELEENRKERGGKRGKGKRHAG